MCFQKTFRDLRERRLSTGTTPSCGSVRSRETVSRRDATSPSSSHLQTIPSRAIDPCRPASTNVYPKYPISSHPASTSSTLSTNHSINPSISNFASSWSSAQNFNTTVKFTTSEAARKPWPVEKNSAKLPFFPPSNNPILSRKEIERR